MSLIMTKAALALKNAENNFQFVKFEAHKPKKKVNPESGDSVHSSVDKPPMSKKDLELKKIRHEVVKFGMSGFDATKKEEAKIALAVSLGAKPLKRPYVNYKELMQKRKEEREKETAEKQLMITKSNIMQGVGKKKQKGVSKKNDVGHFLDSYGKVNKKDLKKKEEKGPPKKKKKMKISG